MNNVKTFMLMAGLMALFLGLGQMIAGQQGLIMALVLGSAMNFIMYFFSDPQNTGHHDGPIGTGHLGDLPALSVNIEGKAEIPVVARRLEMSDLRGHSLIIHAGGDNYSDVPQKLGGGGPRIACGIINP